MAVDSSTTVLGLPLIYFIAIVIGGVFLLAMIFLLAHCIHKRARLRKQMKGQDRGAYAKIETADSKLRPLSTTSSVALQNIKTPDVENQISLDQPSRFSLSSISTAGRRDGSPNKLRKQRDQYEPRRDSQGPSKYPTERLYDDPSQLLSMPYGALSMQKDAYLADSRRTSATGSVLAATPMSEADDPVNTFELSDTGIPLPPVIPRKSSRRNSSPNPVGAPAVQHTEGSQLERSPRMNPRSLQRPIIPDRRSSSQPRQVPYPTLITHQRSSSPKARSKSPEHMPEHNLSKEAIELDAAGTPVRMVRRSSSIYSTPEVSDFLNATMPLVPRKSSKRISRVSNSDERERDQPELPRKSSRRDSRRIDREGLLDRRELFME